MYNPKDLSSMNNERKIVFLFAWGVMLFLISGCSPSKSAIPIATATFSCELGGVGSPSFVLPTLPYPENATVIENEGFVCFYALNSPIIHAQVYPPSHSCFSSTCSRVFERTGDMKIDQEDHVIQFSSRFVAQRYYISGCQCTADCGGAGFIQFDLPSIPNGTYTIKLGGMEIGEVQLPVGELAVCVNE